MHIKSAKHTRGKLKLLQQKKTEVTETLKPYDSVNHAVGESLPDSTRVFRVKVVQTFLVLEFICKKYCTTFTRSRKCCSKRCMSLSKAHKGLRSLEMTLSWFASETRSKLPTRTITKISFRDVQQRVSNSLMEREVPFIGHVAMDKGIQADPGKLKAITRDAQTC